MARFAVGVPLILLFASVAFAQNPPQSDPQAVSFASQSIAALTGGQAIKDVTLTGDVTWSGGGSPETGTGALMAKGTAESRVDLNLSGGLRSDIRNDSAGYPQGATSVNGGKQQAWALHNCWINASWFFPALSFLGTTSDPSLVFSYVGQESRNGRTVQHLRIYRHLTGPKPDAVALTQQLSTLDVYLDAGTLLPLAFDFNMHPDDDAKTNNPVEIDFSNYQSMNGVQVPLHLQKFMQGSLALDVVVTSAVFNSGLSESLFAIQGR